MYLNVLKFRLVGLPLAVALSAGCGHTAPASSLADAGATATDVDETTPDIRDDVGAGGLGQDTKFDADAADVLCDCDKQNGKASCFDWVCNPSPAVSHVCVGGDHLWPVGTPCANGKGKCDANGHCMGPP